MTANSCRVEDFLSSARTQFIIPVYQRNYDWSIMQCRQLLNDILAVGYNKKASAHFIGSIVYIHDNVYTATKMKELTIIDGQQRLTTLTLIYIALVKLAKEQNNDELFNEINETYLINKFASNNEKLKLRPVENNDKALQYLLSNKEDEFTGFSNLIENYNFFREKISNDNYKYIMEGISKLIFVEISLERGKDDQQKIFESLNSTGLELSQADLIRNYILVGLNRSDQNRIYNEYWSVIEMNAKEEISNTNKVSDFIRDYLTLENKKIPNKGKVYNEFKEKYPAITVSELNGILGKIKGFVKYYNKLLNPKNESDSDIREQLEYINRLESNIAYPFLLKVYDDYSKNSISKAVFVEILKLIQTYIWRRFIVGLPSNALNKIFMNLYDKVELNNYLYSIQKSLLQRSGIQRFPKDDEVMKSLHWKDVYNINSKNKMYILDRLENFQNYQERVVIEGNQDITIEHIFPQNPDIKWKNILKNDEYSTIKEKYLNTISNLTLSGNNGKLGNKYFTEKRDLPGFGYKDSRLWLNNHLKALEKWDIEELEVRFEIIKKRFLEIWEYPNIKIEDDDKDGEVNIFDADDPTNKKLEYILFFDQKIAITHVTNLYTEIIRQLFELQPSTFFTTDLAVKLKLISRIQKDTLSSALDINETYCIEGQLNNVEKFEKIKYTLSIFEIEDELIIKYANN